VYNTELPAIRCSGLTRLSWYRPFGLNESAVHENVYITAQKNLYALKELLDTNPQLFHSAPGDQAGARGATTSEQEAWKAEQSSVSQMLSLLTRTIEAISFVLLLIDHRWGELITQCDPSAQKSLSDMTFEDLVTSQNGVTVSRALVNIVIDQQIGQQISVGPLSLFCIPPSSPHGLGLGDEFMTSLRATDLVAFIAHSFHESCPCSGAGTNHCLLCCHHHRGVG
jgi:hypothetical protein